MELERVFNQILVFCKINKFKEVNYKILSRILLTLKILAKIKDCENISICVVCGAVASLEHILLTYPSTRHLYHFIFDKVHKKWSTVHWIFGLSSTHLNPVIWLANFTIYKYHLMACHGRETVLQQLFVSEYKDIYACLHIFQDGDH